MWKVPLGMVMCALVVKQKFYIHSSIQKSTRWWFQICLMFAPILAEMIQFDEHIFSDGLVKPPTRIHETRFFFIPNFTGVSMFT